MFCYKYINTGFEMEEIAVEHLKSGFSINTHVGCTLGCKYCVLSSVNSITQGVKKIRSTTEIMDELLKENSLFINGETPLYINNRTDPFLKEVKDSTYEMLEQLYNHNIKSPILLITKLSPDERIVKYMNYLNLMFFYTYTGLPKGIDFNSYSNIHEKNIKNIINYVPKKSRFLYARPIIPGLNDSKERFEEVLKTTGYLFDTVIVGGVRILDFNKEIIEEIAGKKILHEDREHKFFESSFYDKVIDLGGKYGVCIVRHTSCVIARCMGKKCKLRYFKRAHHCSKMCMNYNVCSNGYADESNINIEFVVREIKKRTNSRFIYENNEIKFQDEVTQELIAFVKCAFGLKASSKKMCLSPSEEFFLNHNFG